MGPLYVETPYISSNRFWNTTTDVFLKLEALQPSGSFKSRGMSVACQHYFNQGCRKFISSSGGNAGLAVAWAGHLLGADVTVVIPESTHERARDLLALEGAQVIVHGQSWADAHQYAQAMVTDESVLLHPFDSPTIWDGHSTMIEEIARQGPKPGGIILSVGGGGLLIGVIKGLDKVGWSDVPVLAVETEGAASLHRSRLAGRIVELDEITTVATSLGATRVADKAFSLVSQKRVKTTIVTDKQAITACSHFLDDHRMLVEPACGAALATVYENNDWVSSKDNVAVIVCGGTGTTHSQLHTWNQHL